MAATLVTEPPLRPRTKTGKLQYFLNPRNLHHRYTQLLTKLLHPICDTYYNDKLLRPAFLTKSAIALTRSFTKSRFDPDVRFCLKTTVCCESSCLHQNQLEFEQKAIYLA